MAGDPVRTEWGIRFSEELPRTIPKNWNEEQPT